MALNVNGNYLTAQVNKDTDVISTDNSVQVTESESGTTKVFDLSVRPDGNSHWVNGVADGSVRTTTSTEEDSTYALGYASVAEGHNTKAAGHYSHAEGELTETADYAHAEGSATKALGTYSHTEGSQSETSGNCSHAEGFASKATADDAHAEGGYTTASGIRSHAEGGSTTASGESSHAEGGSTTASGYSSHAEGSSTTASGDYSHAEGESTQAKAICSHAEGYQTIAAGDIAHGSHAEGYQSVAGGTAAHAEGYQTCAYDYGHSEGNYTLAIGNSAAHAEGWRTIAKGSYSHAEGEGGNPYEDNGFSIVSYDSDNNNLLVDGDLRIFLNQANNFMPLVRIIWGSQTGKPIFFATLKSYEESTNQTILGLQRIRPYEAFSELPTSEDNITNLGVLDYGAINVNSHTEGQFTCAYGACSHAEGIGTKTTNEGEHAGGWLNESIRNAYDGREVYEEHGTLFSLGNGYVERVGDERVVHRRNAFDIRFDGSIYAPQVKQGAGTLQNLSLDANGQIVIGSAGGGSMTEVTASELRTLIADSELKAGAFYRVTDYQCTRTDFSDSQNATHQFDIVLLALDANTLNQKGWCIRHEGDSYFSSVHMEQWQVWFDIALDTYGRVLRLIDENRNDCPYDFKNVKWLHPTDNAYYYTFAVVSGDNVTDHSLNGTYCYGNTMGIGCHHIIFKNTSTSAECHSNTFGNKCYSNTFGNKCYSNTFGENCYSNNFGSSTLKNIFEGNNYSIKIEDSCQTVVFALHSYEIELSYVNLTYIGIRTNLVRGSFLNNAKIGDFCYNIHFESSCYDFTIGNNCSNIHLNSCYGFSIGEYCKTISLGNEAIGFSIGNYCQNISLGDSVYGFSIGNYCQNIKGGNYLENITLGEGCSDIYFGQNSSNLRNYYKNIIIDNGNRHIYLDCTGTLSSSSKYQNVHIGLGVNNTSTYKTITDANVNQTYQTEYLPTGSQTINV